MPQLDRDRSAKGRAARYLGVLLQAYDVALSWFDRAASLVVIIGMATLSTVIILQVFYRYALNSSLDWGWEVPRLCFVWVVFLSIPLGIKRGRHVGIDILFERLQPRAQRAVYRLIVGLIVALMTVVGYEAGVLAHRTWDQLLPTLDLSTGYFYVALIICCIHSVLHLLKLLWTGIPPSSGSFD